MSERIVASGFSPDLNHASILLGKAAHPMDGEASERIGFEDQRFPKF